MRKPASSGSVHSNGTNVTVPQADCTSAVRVIGSPAVAFEVGLTSDCVATSVIIGGMRLLVALASALPLGTAKAWLSIRYVSPQVGVGSVVVVR